MNQWQGKKVAFLGDSMTDKCIESVDNYWMYLEKYLGIQPIVYGINGNQWINALDQAKKLKAEHGSDVDAVIVFIGTNDYNNAVPIGEWWSFREEETNSKGVIVKRMRRIPNMGDSTVCGRINQVMSYLKNNFPLQQIILLTPIHRGFARFSEQNVQPEESFPNNLGIYLDDYIRTTREAGSIWAVPVIDLHSLSGLFPVSDAYTRFFNNPETDRLHPSSAGHERIAKTLMYQLLALPATFR